MNKEVKQIWVKALNSGKYLQAKGTLKGIVIEDSPTPEMGYCCLGVLCDLYREKTGQGEWIENDEFFVDGTGHRNDTALTADVANWAGLKEYDPVFYDSDSHKHRLSHMNDTGTSFEDISKEIEKYF